MRQMGYSRPDLRLLKDILNIQSVLFAGIIQYLELIISFYLHTLYYVILLYTLYT